MKDGSGCAGKPASNTCLGFFEALASVLVVFIHIRFPGIAGEAVEGLARFAVPLFFTVSGFYLTEKEMTGRKLRKKLLARIRRIGKITLFSFALYFVLLGGQALAAGTFSAWLVSSFHRGAWAELLLFNNPLLMVTNWFLVALLFCYFIIYLFPAPFARPKTAVKVIACSLPIWVLVRLLMMATKAEIGGRLLSDPVFYRSWYAAGLPFLCFGLLLRQKKDQLKAVSAKVLYPGLILSAVEMTLANVLFIRYLGDGIAYYCGSVFTVFFILCFAARKPRLFCGSRLLNSKGNWTVWLYVCHPAVIGIVQVLVQKAGLDRTAWVLWTEPLLVLALSVPAALLCRRLTRRAMRG